MINEQAVLLSFKHMDKCSIFFKVFLLLLFLCLFVCLKVMHTPNLSLIELIGIKQGVTLFCSIPLHSPSPSCKRLLLTASL